MEKTLLERMQESKANHGVAFFNYMNNGDVYKDEFYRTKNLELSQETFRYDLVYKAEDHDENGNLKEDAEPLNNIVRFYTADVNCYLDGEQTNTYDYGRLHSRQSFIDYDLLVNATRNNGLIFNGPDTFEEFKEAIKSGEPFNINVEASLLPKEDTKEVVQNKVVEEVKTEEKPKSLIKKFLGF